MPSKSRNDGQRNLGKNPVVSHFSSGKPLRNALDFFIPSTHQPCWLPSHSLEPASMPKRQRSAAVFHLHEILS